jgi:hypothetical protein
MEIFCPSDATSLSVPASFVAKSKGFFELGDYDALGLTYPQHAVATLRPTIAKNPVPTPSVQVISSALDMISVHYPQAKQTDPNLIVDPSFVRRLDQSGFISALYKK